MVTMPVAGPMAASRSCAGDRPHDGRRGGWASSSSGPSSPGCSRWWSRSPALQRVEAGGDEPTPCDVDEL